MESKTVEIEVVFLEGLDKTLGKRIQADLQAVGFVVGIHDDPHYRDSKRATFAIAAGAVGGGNWNRVSLCANHSSNPLTRMYVPPSLARWPKLATNLSSRNPAGASSSVSLTLLRNRSSGCAICSAITRKRFAPIY
jgi:hypothetical protein